MSKGTLKRTMDEASLSPEATLPKKYQESSSPENEMNLNIQSQASLSDKLSKISVDTSACCNEPCDGDGAKGQALQCDLCEGWFHVLCENMSNKQYKPFSSLVKLVPNMLYFCNYNKCHLRLKHIVGEFVRSSADMSEKLSGSIESTLQRHDKSLVSTFNRSHWKT